MSNASTKKKFSFGKLLIWVIIILVALHFITDGESTYAIEDFFYEILHSDDDYIPEPQPAYMGATIEDVEGITGAYISAVTPNGPAANAGLQIGDVIVTIGDTPINSYDEMVAKIQQFYAYDTTRIIVLRNGNYVTLELTFVEIPQDTPSIPTTPQGTVPQQSAPAVTTPAVTAPPAIPEADRLPSVPAELRNHVYLGARDWGYCEKLTGNTVITVIFISNPDGSWTDAEIADAKTQLQSTVARITSDAASYGAQVNISLQYKTCSTSVQIIDGDADNWMESALAAAGLPDRKTINTALEAAYGADSAPVIFFANHGGRAIASSYYGNEYAILYDDTHAFYHELSHIYGAKDFYYPDEVEELTETYIPNSIMVRSSDGVMDDFTAYLIGWTDTLSQNAMGFLQSTAYLTQDYLSEEKAKETYTGYVTDFTYGGGSYTGYLVKGVKHGQGKWIRDDGTVWEGTFNHGSFTGTGNYIYESGAVYNGQWVNGKLHGKGTMTWADGNKYTGDFVEGKRTGKGTMTWADGTIYTGDFVENERTGQGTWTGATGNTYTGGFLNGNFHGQGTYKWASGGSYTGSYINGQESGQGKMIYANGSVYEGTWQNGKRHGQGTIRYADGSSYVGQWADGVQNGKGTLTYTDGATYVGDWAGGKRHGQGTLSYANGNVYSGSWANDTWNGEGTFTWTSGDKYTGAFVDGKRHGYGIYYYPSGNRYEGQWSGGNKHGQGTMYYANGTSKTGTWDNDKFVG